jgi:hypothetical protein
LTIVLTVPEASLIAEAGISESPPTLVTRTKSTVAPVRGWPAMSLTMNDTTDVSVRPAPPAPFNEILVGEAETKAIELTAGLVTTGGVTVVPEEPTPVRVIGFEIESVPTEIVKETTVSVGTSVVVK